MSGTPVEPGTGADSAVEQVPAGDLGAGGPADDPGSGEGPRTPPGYPEEVDPAQGPLADRAAENLGDLEDPGAQASR